MKNKFKKTLYDFLRRSKPVGHLDIHKELAYAQESPKHNTARVKDWDNPEPIVSALYFLFTIGEVNSVDVIKFETTGVISTENEAKVYEYLRSGYVNVGKDHSKDHTYKSACDACSSLDEDDEAAYERIGRKIVNKEIKDKAKYAAAARKAKKKKKKSWLHKLLNRFKKNKPPSSGNETGAVATND